MELGKIILVLLLSGLLVRCGKNESDSNSSAMTSGAQDTSQTNLQESGVDEGDYTKIGKSHFFILTDKAIDIVDRKSLSYLGSLEVTSGFVPQSLYVHGEDLIVLSSNNDSKISIYSTEEGKMPLLKKELRIKGVVHDSRIVHSDLVLVMDGNNTSTDTLSTKVGEKSVLDVPCDQVTVPVTEDNDTRLVRIAVINLEALSEPVQYSGVMASGDDIYVTEKSIYLGKRVHKSKENYDYEEATLISRVKIADHKPDVVASGFVPGRTKDKWAYKEFEKEETLLVATSCGQLWSGKAANHLWSVNQKSNELKIVGGVDDYGQGEDIRAVRYVNDLAYVVTFKKTDPLFAFDVSNPVSPKLLGELKVPGFSTYLHPLPNKRLIGIGFDALEQGSFALFQGIQVSLFDVANPLEMNRMDNVVLGARGSSSDITSDHHAFFYDEDSRLLGVPVVEIEGTEGWNYYGNVQFSGAKIFEVGNHNLNKAGSLTHKKWIDAKCPNTTSSGQWWQYKSQSIDINRLYRVDGKLSAISKFGISTHPLDNLSEISAELKFPNRACALKSVGY